MARSLRYFVPMLGLLAVYFLLSGTPASAQAPPAPDTNVAPPSPEKESPEFKNALQAFKERRYEDAATSFEKGRKNHPEMPAAQMFMAQLFYQVGPKALFQAAIERAIKEDPADPEPYVFLARIAQEERRTTEADVLYSKASDLLKTYTNKQRKRMLDDQTINGLAWVAEQRQQWEAAKKYLEMGLESLKSTPAPTDQKEIDNLAAAKAMTLQRLAHAKFGLGDTAGCLTDLTKAYETDKKTMLTPEARMAQFYEQIGGERNHGFAKTMFDRALQKYPHDFSTHLAAAKWYFGSQPPQLEDAKKEANEALKIDSSSLEAKLVRGTISLWQKNFAEAEKDFQNAIYQKPNEVAASNNLALALCEQDDQAKKNRALQYAETNVRQYSQSPDTASTLAWCLYKAGQVPQADEWIRKTMQFSGGNWKEDALFYAAQIGYDSGRKEQSKQELDLLLKSDRPFMMRPEAKVLQKKILDEEKKASAGK